MHGFGSMRTGERARRRNPQGTTRVAGTPRTGRGRARGLARAGCVALLAGASAMACAQTSTAPAFPARAVRLIVPFAPGGGADVLGRLFALKLGEAWGRPVVVENRTGAGGNVGAETTARAVADGHTAMLTTNSLAVNVTLYPKAGYSALTDLAPVALVARVPLVLVVHPSVPARSVRELVELARRRPGGINFGSNGSGTTSHLSGVYLGELARIRVEHIPYKGAGAVFSALLAGEVDMGFVGAIGAQPHLKSGRLRGLAVTTTTPSAVMPGLPTMASVYPGFETDAWYGVFLPAGVPAGVLAKWHEDVMKAQGAADVRAAMARDGAEAVAMGPTDFAAFFRTEIDKYAKLIRLSGARAE